MKSKLRISRQRLLAVFLIAALSVVMVTCVFLDGVDYPASAKAGETITMTMHASFEPAEDRTTRLVIGFMAPESWDAANNTTVTYTSTYGDGTMSLVPDGTPAPNSDGREWPEGIRNKFGIGGNLKPDVEWVVFWSEPYTVGNNADGTADIDITTRVGDQNMLVKLGFFIGTSYYGLVSSGSYAATQKVDFTECFEVTEGEGNIIDFCNPSLNVVRPSTALENDIVTFAYQGDVADNVLENADPVYLCATGYTAAENAIKICNPGSDKTRMTKESEFVNTWKLTMWPRGYFNVGNDETLTKIEYFFTNEAGTDTLENEAISAPFTYFFTCGE